MSSSAPPTRDELNVSTAALRRFTVAEYHRMIDAGILWEGDPVELLDGLLVTKMVKNPRHDAAVSLVAAAMASLEPDWFARVQSAITTAMSEPEPDVAVVRGPRRRYASAHPTPDEVAIVVEVADSSLERDRGDKARLYARSGVALYWIVNLCDGVVETHADPVPAEGCYRTLRVIGRGASVAVTLRDGTSFTVPVDELLP